MLARLLHCVSRVRRVRTSLWAQGLKRENASQGTGCDDRVERTALRWFRNCCRYRVRRNALEALPETRTQARRLEFLSDAQTSHFRFSVDGGSTPPLVGRRLAEGAG